MKVRSLQNQKKRQKEVAGVVSNKDLSKLAQVGQHMVVLLARLLTRR
jgi:hypothetical protein